MDPKLNGLGLLLSNFSSTPFPLKLFCHHRADVSHTRAEKWMGCVITREFFSALFRSRLSLSLSSAELEMIKSDYWLLMRKGGGEEADFLLALALVF